MTPGRRLRFDRLAGLPRKLAGPLWAVLFVAVATALRLWLGALFSGLIVFSLYYPAILGAALVGGELSAAISLVLSLGLGWLLLQLSWSAATAPAITVDLSLFLFTGAFVGVVGSRLRRLLQRRSADLRQLADREARYRALFDGVSEGFALVEGLWGEGGRLLDLVIVEANPAVLRMFSIDREVAGERQSVLAPFPPDLLAAAERALGGERVRMEIEGPRTRRWFEIRLSPAGENRLAQIVVDISDRKLAESRQAEMFLELNHRVKNNLAAVSAMLGMQARLAPEPQVREQLQRAIDRIQTIGEVHATLYRGRGAEKVDFGDYLQRLCERLSTTLIDGERVRLEVTADPILTSPDDAVALGLIVNELVTNAAKHAYPPPDGGVIRVSLRKTAEGVLLSVSDDGRGLDAPPAAGAGIGMRLVRSLVQQCRGQLEVGAGPGASFVVRLGDCELHLPAAAQSQLL